MNLSGTILSYARGAAPAYREHDFKGPPQTLQQFKAVVMERQVVYHMTIKKRVYCAAVPESDLDIIEKPHRMRTVAAADCRALLDDARAQLARAKQDNDPLAKTCSKIVVHSAYRTLSEDTASWQNTFNEHYNDMLMNPKLAADPFGRAAQRHMYNTMVSFKAVPGFSNHSNGLAVDFGTTQGGTYLGAKSKLINQWKKTWLHSWLLENAGNYNFRELNSEPWHWDHDP